MDLYDIHTHDALTSDSDDDVPKRDITYILNVYPLGFEYAKDSESCNWFSCGVHPWYLDDPAPQIKFLKEIATDSRIVAIGEAGFDKLKGTDIQTQKIIFEQQIELSEQLQKPLIIHCVKAWEELLHMQKKHKPRQTWIIHGYRGKEELTKQLVSHGFMFSLNDRFNAEGLHAIPIDRIFCETDESDASIEEVYDKVAESLNMDIESFTLQIEKNVKKVFPMIVSVKELEEDFS